MGLRESAAAISMMGKRINRIPLLSPVPVVRISSRAVNHDSPETLLTLMLAFSAEFIAASASPVV